MTATGVSGSANHSPRIDVAHEHGTVAKERWGWRGICDCGWQGPWKAHPLDAGATLTDHALEQAIRL